MDYGQVPSVLDESRERPGLTDLEFHVVPEMSPKISTGAQNDAGKIHTPSRNNSNSNPNPSTNNSQALVRAPKRAHSKLTASNADLTPHSPPIGPPPKNRYHNLVEQLRRASNDADSNLNLAMRARHAADPNSSSCSGSRIVNAHWPPTTFKPIYVQVTRIKIILPIKSIASLKSLNARLVTDRKVHEALFEELTKIGCAGRDYQLCIMKILDALVLPQVHQQLSWVGSESKMEFGNSSVQQTVSQAVRFHFPKVTDAELEFCIKNWLMANPTA